MMFELNHRVNNHVFPAKSLLLGVDLTSTHDFRRVKVTCTNPSVLPECRICLLVKVFK
jgi:hypothetical protein